VLGFPKPLLKSACNESSFIFITYLKVFGSIRQLRRFRVIDGMSNSLVGDRYRLIQLLNTVNNEQIYVAEDTRYSSAPPCILKRFQLAGLSPHELITLEDQFQLQTQIRRELSAHDQIPRLLDAFATRQGLYWVEERIEGHALTLELETSGLWSEAQVLKLLQQILPVLIFIHQHSGIHGNLKPENLIRRYRDHQLVLTNFVMLKPTVNLLSNTAGEQKAPLSAYTPPTWQARAQLLNQLDLQNLGQIAMAGLHGNYHRQLARGTATEAPIEADVGLEEQLRGTELEYFLLRLMEAPSANRFPSAEDAWRELLRLVEFQAPSPSSFAPTLEEQLTSKFGALLPTEQLESIAALVARFQPDRTRGPETLLSGGRRQRITLGLFLSLVAAFGLLAMLVNSILKTPRPEWQTVLQTGKRQQQAGNYQACLRQAAMIPQGSPLYARGQTLAIACQLQPARELAATGQLESAIGTLVTIPPSDHAYLPAQQLVGQWSDTLLIQALQQYRAGDFPTAIATAQQIPAASPVSQQAQAAISSWQQEWQANTSNFELAQQALEQRKWPEAIAIANRLTVLGHPAIEEAGYWQQKIVPLLQTAQAESAKLASTQSKPLVIPTLSPAPVSPTASP
jgi:serine/threonine protein kinase